MGVERTPESGDPGPLIGSGRSADVFDLGGGRVLRRYRTSNERTDHERRVMRHLYEAGLSVPQVFDLRQEDQPDRDIVMERIDGPTMIEDLERRPWMVVSHARRLARIQREIGAVPAPDWMMSPGWAMAPADGAGHRDGVLHLDLHPMNVMLSERGPVVIDWANSTGGPAGFDAAITYVEMAGFEVDDPKSRIGQQLMVSVFRRARGGREIDAFLVAACDHRLADPGITPGERMNVAAMRKKALAGRPS